MDIKGAKPCLHYFYLSALTRRHLNFKNWTTDEVFYILYIQPANLEKIIYCCIHQ
uniref:Uncharacterized protein n=1 Tax=Sphingobacterium sp. (strain 21) TaxID=743722 RepID=F4C4N6_SPHS2